MNKVYFFDFENNIDGCEKHLSLLCEDEKKRLSLYRDPLNKAQLLYSRALLYYALKSENLKYEKILYSKKGKPFFEKGFPFFSISHSKTAVAVILGESEVGLDIQYKKEIKSESFINKVFSKNEIKLVKNNIFSLTDLWCMKESYLKYTGDGIALLLSQTEISYKDKMISVNKMPVTDLSTEKYSVFVCKNDYLNKSDSLIFLKSNI